MLIDACKKMKQKNSEPRPPKIFKRHRKQDRETGRRTCWRSIKWKIAILCCSSQGRKDNGPYTRKMPKKSRPKTLNFFQNFRKKIKNGRNGIMTSDLGSSLINNLFVLAFVFSQVYLLHRFGSHRAEYERNESY